MRAANQLVILQEQANAIYNAEKEITGVFDALQANTTNANLKEGITREADENKRHRVRLEGLIAVLNRDPFRNGGDEISKEHFTQ